MVHHHPSHQWEFLFQSVIPISEAFFYGPVSIAQLESTSCCIAASLEMSLILSKAYCQCCHSLKRMDLGKNQPVKCNPFCIFKGCFPSLCSGRPSLRAFLVWRYGDINSRRAHLLLSDHDNREMIHIYSFGKRRAQHWSHSIPVFLPWSPWENKPPSMSHWRMGAACTVWKSWESDQPVEGNEDECSTSPLPGWILVCCLEKVTFFQAWQIFAELCFRFEVATLLSPCSLLLLCIAFGVCALSHAVVGGAGQTIWGSRCVAEVWWDGKSSSILHQAGSQVAVEYHLVSCPPWCLAAGEGGEAPIQGRELLQEQHWAAGLKRLWVSSHLFLSWLLKTSTIHRAKSVWMNKHGINMLLVLAMLK